MILFFKLLLPAIVLMAIAFIGFATRMLLVKGGRFPQTSIGKNREMYKRGITCVKCDEQKACGLPGDH